MNKTLNDIIKSKKVILMDFDGTITDTEPLNYLTWVRCLEPYGIEFTKKDFEGIIGHPISEIADYFQNKYPERFDRDEFLGSLPKYIEIFMEIEEEHTVPMFDYVKVLLNDFPNVPKYIVSNQTRPLIDNLLVQWGVQDKFKRVISCMDEKLNKLDIYDQAVEYFGVPANECVLCEDMQKYLNAGKERGMATIGIQHQYNKVESADLIIDITGKEINHNT